LEHHRSRPARAPARLPCFWWTACLLTPSASAMSCHDQPSRRALTTWSASSRSSRRRRASTARSPTLGSVLLAAAASSCASFIASTYLDGSGSSRYVDVWLEEADRLKEVDRIARRYWWSIEVFDAEGAPASAWQRAHGNAFVEAAITNGAVEWKW